MTTTYCYRCRSCGHTDTASHRHGVTCPRCDLLMPRDYQAENVGFGVANLKRTREHPVEEYAAKFLPTNKDFATKSDPEGKKGMKKWREEHAPADSNSKPYWPGEVERTSF